MAFKKIFIFVNFYPALHTFSFFFVCLYNLTLASILTTFSSYICSVLLKVYFNTLISSQY